MRELLLFLAVAALLPGAQARARAATAAPAASSAWERMTYPGEEFSAEWPAAPFAYPTRRIVRATPFKSEEAHHFGAYSEGAIFLVSSYARPTRDETLEYFVEDLRRSRWNVVWKEPGREVSAGGVRGVELRFESNGVTGAARVFRAARHAYVVRAFSRNASDPSVDRFLNSFTLSERPQGRAIRVPEIKAIVEAPPASPPGPGRGGGGDAQPPGASQPSAGGASGEALAPSAATRRAVIMYRFEPGYTEEARRASVTGTVRLRAILGADGRVSNVSVIKGLRKGLTERAVLAAHCILFFPAEKDGRRVSQYVTLEYNFNIY